MVCPWRVVYEVCEENCEWCAPGEWFMRSGRECVSGVPLESGLGGGKSVMRYHLKYELDVDAER